MYQVDLQAQAAFVQMLRMKTGQIELRKSCAHCTFDQSIEFTVWDREPDMTHQTSWPESTGECVWRPKTAEQSLPQHIERWNSRAYCMLSFKSRLELLVACTLQAQAWQPLSKSHDCKKNTNHNILPHEVCWQSKQSAHKYSMPVRSRNHMLAKSLA